MGEEKEIAGYLISAAPDEPANYMFYKLSQKPTNWMNKGFLHNRDANIIYKAHCEMANLIIEEFRNRNFPFERFYRDHMKEVMAEIINGRDMFLPDFDAYYNLMHLSLENFLKGIWLDLNSDKLGFTELPKILVSHSLLDLLSACEIRGNREFLELFRWSSQNFMSYMRYPISLKMQSNDDPMNWDPGGKDYEMVCFDIIEEKHKYDKALFDKFLKKIKSRIEKVFQREDQHMEIMFGPFEDLG